MKIPSLRVEEKVAQLFMVGSDTLPLSQEVEPFYRTGLGGLILFRHHLQPFDTATDLRDYLAQENRRFQGGGLSFIGVDQEGGQVERLPHWYFPTGILPVAYGHKQDPAFCEQVNREVARRLKWLGFNLNFTPTVDLNRERLNPIIGVRAYGETPEAVIPFAQSVIRAHQAAGVLAVAKHFPGHGSGTVDSHLDLPMFETWSDSELTPYEALIRQNNLFGVLVAHGLYPQLARMLGADWQTPASLSYGIVTQLLKDKLGFQGLVFTDDLMMGAVWGDSDPVEVAIKALEAGADMLVYRRAQPEAWLAYEAMVSRVQRGKFPESALDDKVQRILTTKTRLNAISAPDYPASHLSEEACHTLSLQWAQAGLVELHHQFISPLPLSHTTPWALVAPDRNTMRHYQPDTLRGRDLSAWFAYYGLHPVHSLFYPTEGEAPFPHASWPDVSLEVIVFVAFNSMLSPQQQQLYEQLKSKYPQAKMILASCGMPTDGEVLSRPWVHVQLPSFRPAAMQAFAQWLISSPQGTLPTWSALTPDPGA